MARLSNDMSPSPPLVPMPNLDGAQQEPALGLLLDACGQHLSLLALMMQRPPEDDEETRDIGRAFASSAAALSRQFSGAPSRTTPPPAKVVPGRSTTPSTSATASIPATPPPKVGLSVGTLERRRSGSKEAAGSNSPAQASGSNSPNRRSSEENPMRSSSKQQSREWEEDQVVLKRLQSKELQRTSSSLKDVDGSQGPERRHPLYSFLFKLVGNARFESFWAFIVFLNTLTMVIEEEYRGIQVGSRLGVYEHYGSEAHLQRWWPAADHVIFGIEVMFAVLFTVEILLMYSYDLWNLKLGQTCPHRDPFWKSPLDIIDLFVITASNFTLMLDVSGPLASVKFIRILRLVRLMRLVRLVRKLHFLDPLHQMVTALSGSLGALFFSTVLLALVVTIFAMLATQFFRFVYLTEQSPLTDAVQKELYTYFGTYTRSMLSMFELTLANWPIICRFLVDEVHEVLGVFCVLYKLSVGFAVIGVINGVFIQETFSVATNDEFIMVRKRMKQMKQHAERITRLFMMADENGDGMLTKDELQSMLQKRAIRTWLEAMELRCTDADMLFELIADGKEEISIDEFITGIGRLKGPARNIDVLTVLAILQENYRENMKHHEMALQKAIQAASIMQPMRISLQDSAQERESDQSQTI